ncbi:MAG TPA: endonuclease III [Dissulfurispiraceae bacterium]|nr:endonuclease III [Dissulfurispiraceae bacterium]
MPDAKISVKNIVNKLFKNYPDPVIALHFRNPFELLIATILSAQCPDTRVNKVTETLFLRYRTAEQFAQSDGGKLESEISSITYYRNKAKTIVECCRKLVSDFKGKVPQTLDQLVTLPGVGRKTANVILGCAFGQQAIAVDTHVLRVADRLGLSHSKNADKMEQELMRQIPQDKWTRFSLALILHGRETCTAKNPRCSICVLYSECAWPEKTLWARK